MKSERIGVQEKKNGCAHPSAWTALHGSWAWSARDSAFVVLLTLAALAVRLYRLDYRGMWTDEFHTLNAVLLPWRDLISERMRQGHLPTYFLLLKLWTSWAGTSDWALRLPSALTGALLVPAVALFARPYLARRVFYALLAVAVVHGTAIWASQEARMYGMLLVAATLCHAAYLRTVRCPQARTWLAYFAALAAGAALQPVMLLSFLGHLAFSYLVRLRYPQHARSVRHLTMGLAILAGPPVVAFSLFQRARSWDWDIHSVADFLRITTYNLSTLIKRLGLIAFGCSDDNGWWRAVTALAMITCLAGVVRGWRSAVRRETSFATTPQADFIRFCAISVAVPSALLYIVSYGVEHLIGVERYHIPSAVPLWTLCVLGVLAYHGRIRAAMLGIFCALLLAGAIRHWRDRGLGGREIVEFVNANANANDIIVCRATPTLIRMIEHYSKRPLALCPIPEHLDASTALAKLQACCAGVQRLWVIEYREKGKRLKQLILSQPDRFTPLREETVRQARAVLLKINTP